MTRGAREDATDAAGTERRRPLTALALLLMAVEPLGLAFYASSILTRVVERGAWAIVLLVIRVAITGVGVGAGLALWHGRPGAVRFARVAVALTVVGVLLTFLSPVFPHNRPPGTTGPVLAALLVYYGAWFVYLARLRARPTWP